ncbi:MAG: aminomethyltransferase beta-barrel domain-containing protein [Desulfobacterales bacterium]|nr:aminomethyltransferase beta-barrel domain-containing protein [Desulfobacterales bacterium]
MIASQINWIAVDGLKQAAELKAKIRYAHREAEVMVTPLDKERLHVEFKLPQMAIAPGQTIVFYDGDTVVGGGIIEKKGENKIWAE